MKERTHGSGRAPAVIAHRAGAADMPENTLAAVGSALALDVDMLWLSVQVTRDDVPVLYRPSDLGVLTDGDGRVADRTAARVTRLNAGHAFRDERGALPHRSSADPALRVPRLDDALRSLPAGTPVVLDLKSPLEHRLTAAVARTMDRLDASGVPSWERALFYSTRATALRLIGSHPRARVFESREATRNRLLTCRLAGHCTDPPPPGTWAGFALHHDLGMTERLTLGTGTCTVPGAVLWNPETVTCFRRHPPVHIVLFGVNDSAGYRTALALGADAVLTDSPREMARIRADEQAGRVG